MSDRPEISLFFGMVRDIRELSEAAAHLHEINTEQSAENMYACLDLVAALLARAAEIYQVQGEITKVR